MERSYSVKLGETPVGKVAVHKEGLYYVFSCRCNLSGEQLYRLVVNRGCIQENLGILVPENGCFVLNTRISVKRIGEGEMSFRLVAKREENPKKIFVPIYPEEPFSYISRLKRSFLVYQCGLVGINIEKMQE